MESNNSNTCNARDEVYFSLYETYIGLEVDDDIPNEYINLCVEYLNNLSEEIILSICTYSLDYCKDVMKNYCDVEFIDGLHKIISLRDILNYMKPVSLQIDQPDYWYIPAINLYFKCAWDQDNDMQVLINNDRVVYVGPYEGLDCWLKNLSEWSNYVTGYKI
ncbi:DUF6985 domain-containing protein [Gorillibacterium massiliense]|uniref:DUF6985 domain-containing protein n=1 Tax=Gorillibacterium massiliense TaxID=1280390 RepID=UPI0005933477|nr:hypothetical protein [Gorillibacterium massiliense]